MFDFEKYLDVAFNNPEGIGYIKQLIINSFFKIEFNTSEKSSNYKVKNLDEIGEIFNGNSINETEKKIKFTNVNGRPYIATKDVGYGFDELNYDNGISIPYFEKKFREAPEGAVLLCMEGGSAGKKCGIVKKNICFGNKLVAIVPKKDVSSRFILYFYFSSFFKKQFFGEMSGIIGGVSISKFKKIKIAMPPLQKQLSIVDKLDNFFNQLDEISKIQEIKINKRVSLHASSINALLTASDRSEFNISWKFIVRNFSELYSVTENITELRKAILQLAIMGKLVPQDIKDEPAEVLLEKIKSKKEKLLSEKKIKKEKSVDQLNDKRELFLIPKGWSFAKLQQLTRQITDGEHATPQRTDHGKLLLSARNVTNEGIKLEKVDYVSLNVFEKIRERCAPQRGDIFLSCSGSVGRVCLVDEDDAYSLVRSVALIKPMSEFVSSEYICYALRSPFLQDQIKKSSKTTAQSNIFLGPISNLIIPVPPLNEQKKIVDKVYNLMKLCDVIETHILNQHKTSDDLLNSIINTQLDVL